MHSNTYYDLIDTMREEKGCPVCYLVDTYIDRYIDNLLYENVNDSNLRERLIKSRGFCKEHSEKILKYGYKGYSLGIAIICKDLIEDHLRNLDKIELLNSSRRCLICEVSDDIESRLLNEIINGIKDCDFYEAYRSSDGLCLSHLSKILHLTKDKETRDILLEIELLKLKILSESLSEFIRKQDYRFRDRPIGEEADSWIMALKTLI